MVRDPLIEVEDRDIDTVLDLARNVSNYFTELDDTIHMDYELEELLPDIVTILMGYENPKRSLLILTNAIRTMLEDPDIQQVVKEVTGG
jgi:hypothetical protein